MKKLSLALVLALLVTLLFSACSATSPAEPTEEPTLSVEDKYNHSLDLIASSEYDKAYDILKEIEDYSGVRELLASFLITERETATNSDGTSYTLDVTSNAFGTVIKEEQLKSDGEHLLFEYELDDSGKVIKSTDSSDGYVITWDYIYDEKGNLTEKAGVDTSGNKGSYTYEYDERGNKTKEHYKDGLTSNTTTFTYDENSNLIKKEYKAAFNLFYRVEYFYNEQNQKVKTTWDDANGDSWVRDEVYNENGKVTQSIFIEDGKLKTIDYAYYTDGKLKKTTTITDNGEPFTTEYTYETIIAYTE